MSCNYLLANMISSVYNRRDHFKQSYVDVPCSKLSILCLDVMKKFGYIRDYNVLEVKKNVKSIRVFCSFNSSGNSIINGFKIYSKPGLRTYISAKEASEMAKRYWHKLIIVTTHKGVVDLRSASKMNLGGEILFSVYS